MFISFVLCRFREFRKIFKKKIYIYILKSCSRKITRLRYLTYLKISREAEGGHNEENLCKRGEVPCNRMFSSFRTFIRLLLKQHHSISILKQSNKRSHNSIENNGNTKRQKTTSYEEPTSTVSSTKSNKEDTLSPKKQPPSQPLSQANGNHGDESPPTVASTSKTPEYLKYVFLFLQNLFMEKTRNS